MNKIIQFLREAYAELIRVTWPTRSQTVQYTILVVIISLGVAAFLGALDYIFGIGVKDYLLGTSDPVVAPAIDANETIDIENVEVIPADGEISGELGDGSDTETETVPEEPLEQVNDITQENTQQLEQNQESPEDLQ